jgi:hypothetical protein
VKRRQLLSAGRAVAAGGLVAAAGCLDAVYPPVRGTVRAKRFEGRTADGWRSLVAVTPGGRTIHPDAAGVEGDPPTVPQSLTERLAEAAYDAFRFRVRLELATRDPVAGVPAGETRTYEVDRYGFNVATVGDPLDGRVARAGGDRLAHVESASAGVGGRAGG